MYVLTLFSILSGVLLIAQSYSWGDPCNVMPRGPWNQTDTVDETVPQNCHNGTFRWDYPQGTINLKFPKTNGLSVSVCLRDFLGGDIFIIHDITDGQFIPIEITDRWDHVDIDMPAKEVCTRRHSTAITLRFTAPPTRYYMGEVEYRLQR